VQGFAIGLGGYPIIHPQGKNEPFDSIIVV